MKTRLIKTIEEARPETAISDAIIATEKANQPGANLGTTQTQLAPEADASLNASDAENQFGPRIAKTQNAKRSAESGTKRTRRIRTILSQKTNSRYGKPTTSTSGYNNCGNCHSTTADPIPKAPCGNCRRSYRRDPDLEPKNRRV